MNTKWKIGTSKVNRYEVKDSVAMPEFMARNGLTAYQITTPMKMNLSDKTVDAVLKNAREHQITLSFHAINGTIAIANERSYKTYYEKFWANTFEYCSKLNAPAVCHIHHSYWKDRNKQLEVITDRISRIIGEYEFDPSLIYLESAGKVKEFGANFMELYNLCYVTNTRICVDWAHMLAVYQDNFSENLVNQVLRLLENTSWKYEQYFHLSGINYGSAGEISHQNLEDSPLNWRMILDCIKESDLQGRIILESGYEYCHDALLVKEYLDK